MARQDRIRNNVLSVCEALKAQGCISAFVGTDLNQDLVWTVDGFEKAFHEFTTNIQPFGLKKKGERACLMILITQKNKEAIDNWTLMQLDQKQT